MGALSTFPAFGKTSRRKSGPRFDPWFRDRGPSRAPDVQAVFAEAVRLHVAGSIEEAVVRYHRVLFLQPDNAEVHNNLGVALAAQGKAEAAMVRYKSALSLKPDCADAHNNLGRARGARQVRGSDDPL